MSNKNILIVLISILIILVVILILKNQKTTEEKLERYLIRNKFSLIEDKYYKKMSENDEETFYQNKNNNIASSYEGIYIDPKKLEMQDEVLDYEEEIMTSFHAILKYRENTTIYQCSIKSTNSEIHLEGRYNNLTQKNHCNITSYEGIQLDDYNSSLVCKGVVTYLKNTYYTSKSVIKNKQLLKKVIG